MTLDDSDEAVAALRAVLGALQAAVPTQVGRTAAEFRYGCGDLLAQAPGLLASATVFDALRDCFDAAVAAGATLNGLGGVRRAILALSPSGQAALAVAGFAYCFAIHAEANLLAATTFASSDAALGSLAVFGSAVGRAQEWAADNHLPAVYQSLLATSAAVTRDLTSRAAPLPRLTTYGFPRGTTSHALAYRLYGDANRADELRAEGRVIHPAFMPASGGALSD